MADLPDFGTILFVVIAFLVGYGVISFIIYVLRRGRSQENIYTDQTETFSSGASWDTKAGEMAGEGPEKDEAYYGSVLGLSYNYTVDDIRSSYIKLAAQYHPDKVSHLGPKLKSTAEEEMKKINEAYLYFKRKYNI